MHLNYMIASREIIPVTDTSLDICLGSGSKGLQTISLGQGQGPIAEQMIMEASEPKTSN